MTAKSKIISAHIALLVTCILWSSAFVGIRKTVEYYSPENLALLRYLIASLAMFALYFFKSRKNTVRLKDIPALILLGIIGFSIYNITLNIGEIKISSAIASFIMGQIPVISTLLAMLLFKEKIHKYGIIGLSICVFGIAIIAINSVEHLHLGISTLYILIATICGAIFSTLQKPLLKRIDPYQLAAWAIWGGTIFMLFWMPGLIKQIKHIPFNITLWVAYLGIFPGAVGYAAWSYGIAHLPISKAVSYLYAMPILVRSEERL